MFQVILNESEVEYICSGQILEMSHEFLPQKVARKGNPLISGKGSVVKYSSLTRCVWFL